MPIPPLTGYGVLPAGRYDCTLAEIASVYTGNAHRAQLWADFNSFLQWAKNFEMPANILVDGGFTSDKPAPKDIDVVFDLTGCSSPCSNHWITVWATQRPYLEAQFRVDFWVYFPGAPRDLRGFFEYVKLEEAILRGMGPNDRKGLLRISP